MGTDQARAAAGRGWLIAPVLAAGVLAACFAVLFRSTRPTHSVSAVTRDIQSVALRRSSRVGGDHGGWIGPWWVMATGSDPVTGDLLQFHLSSEPLEISAQRARVVVDPVEDTFAFDLTNAVITRLPQEGEEAGVLMHRDRHLLGPAPLEIDVVLDPDPGALRRAASTGRD
jgi:hypothetical protein